MLIQHFFSPFASQLLYLPSLHPHIAPPRPCSSSLLRLSGRPRIPSFVGVDKAKSYRRWAKTSEEPRRLDPEIIIDEEDDEADDESFPFANGFKEDESGGGAKEDFSSENRYRGRGGERDFDRDPEIAEILGSCFDDPQKAQSRVEDRIRRKRAKILQTKTGSATPMKVAFNKFDFSNSYIWFEFYNTPLPKDLTLICDTIRSWHIVGRLGGCNSMNMQLSQAPIENKRPSYDAIEGANVTPTTFYNIGDLEVQDNLARLWVDIGTTEPLLLDVLINALTCISSDYVGIKQVAFGGSEFQNWKENLTSEEAGYNTHKI